MSFFESLLEGTANAAATSLGSYQKRQQFLEDDERNQRQAIERADTIERNRLKLAEEQRQEIAKRKSEQLQQAEAGGAALGKGQALAELNASYGGNLTESDVLPEEMAAFEDKSQLTKIANQRKYAQSQGLFDADAQLKQDYEATVAAMRQAFKDTMDERKADQNDKRLDVAEKKADAQIAALARPRGGESGGQANPDRLTTQLEKVQSGIKSMEGTMGKKALAENARYQQLLADEDEILATLREGRKATGAKPEPGKGGAKEYKPEKVLNWDPKTGGFK